MHIATEVDPNVLLVFFNQEIIAHVQSNLLRMATTAELARFVNHVLPPC